MRMSSLLCATVILDLRLQRGKKNSQHEGLCKWLSAIARGHKRAVHFMVDCIFSQLIQRVEHEETDSQKELLSQASVDSVSRRGYSCVFVPLQPSEMLFTSTTITLLP